MGKDVGEETASLELRAYLSGVMMERGDWHVMMMMMMLMLMLMLMGALKPASTTGVAAETPKLG